MRLHFPKIMLAAAALGLAACSALEPPKSSNAPPGNPAQPTAGFARFTDIPMPPKNSLDLDRTLIFGTDRDWVGRVSLTTSMSVNDVYDFYKREMPRLGWTELTTVRSATSVLSYQLDNRVATIQLNARRAIIGSSSQVDFWMNPKAGVGASSLAPSGGGYSSPSNSYSPPPNNNGYGGAAGGTAGGAAGGGVSSGGIQSTPLPPQR